VALNLATFGKYADPTDKKTADRVCTGIANATSRAINKAVDAKDARLFRVLGATTIDRFLGGMSHTATCVCMIDLQSHVFDWHATLSAQDPMLFKTEGEWLYGIGGVTLADFGGWM
jgi:hypothetical protein